MAAASSAGARARHLRPVWVGLTIVLVALALLETVFLFRVIDAQHAIGTDLDYYQLIARRWLDTGVWYTDRQLTGPYEVQTLVDNLYPPHALYLFVPFLFLPDILWWIIPLGVVAYVVWWCRPVAWMWPILALILLFPKTPNQILYGNTDMWVAAAIAGGVRWAWPSVLVTFKPSLAFFAVIGIRARSWWIAAGVLVLVSLPFLPLVARLPDGHGQLVRQVLVLVREPALLRHADRGLARLVAPGLDTPAALGGRAAPRRRARGQRVRRRMM